MFSKKALRIGLMALMAVALMSYSIAAQDKKEEKGSEIFTSSLQTPPPGYVIEKSFGSFVVVKEYAAFSFVNSKDVLETIAKATKEAEEIVKKLSGNAILAKGLDTQVTGKDGNRIFVIMQGEAVLLKPVSK